MTADDPERHLIAQQLAYYRARAGEFDESHHRPTPELVGALRAFAPSGRVVEIACGTGIWTAEILRHPVETLLCIDAAPEMLARHQARIHDPRVRRECRDLFGWEPREVFDAAVFTFWLSHVPPSRFAEFWKVLRRALTPQGRVFFIDDDHRAEATEQSIADSSAPIVRRTLADGSEHVAIKLCYEPHNLASQLTALGWDAEVQSVGTRFLWGIARPHGT
jgi:demethylmenaquinone methyltransferase/2-methoxy-6-polyprenyl-1,4-benzoquinol methylase